VSLTLSPLHLFLPVVELQAEVRLGDIAGVSAIFGYGSISLEDDVGDAFRASALEAGGQVTFYPLEPFESFQLGLETIFLRLDADDETRSGTTITGFGEGLAIGPFIGYKLITEGGFTFFVQGGVEYVAIRAEAETSRGDVGEDEDSLWIPLLNLNLGWSF
jgi:hypothetical protein